MPTLSPDLIKTLNRRYQRHRRWCAKVATDGMFRSLHRIKATILTYLLLSTGFFYPRSWDSPRQRERNAGPAKPEQVGNESGQAVGWFGAGRVHHRTGRLGRSVVHKNNPPSRAAIFSKWYPRWRPPKVGRAATREFDRSRCPLRRGTGEPRDGSGISSQHYPGRCVGAGPGA